jgi:hypothetical protein
MDEFTGIAVWVLMAFLIVNASIMWVGSDPFMAYNNVGVTALTTSTMGTIADANSSNTITVFGASCSQATSDPIIIVGCGLANTVSTFAKVSQYFWGMLTAWVGVLNVILNPLGSIGVLFKNILIPVFALIEIFAIAVLLLRVAGIVRGGS